MSMEAWVLVINLWNSNAVTIPGIASEAACFALAERISPAWGRGNLFGPEVRCIRYEGVVK